MATAAQHAPGRRVQADLFEGEEVDLVALAGQGPAPAEGALGHLFWFTISELAITAPELAACLDRAGVPQSLLPGPVREGDAFRRATAAVERRRVPAEAAACFWNLLVREVAAGPHEVVRHLVLETVDAQNVRLGYADLHSLRLIRRHGRIERADLAADASAGAWALAREASARVLDLHREYLSHFNDRHVRQLLAAILGPGQTVCVRPSGGVYFIPDRHLPLLQQARALVGGLAGYAVNGGRSRLYHLPVIDTSEQREMVALSLQEQVEAELVRLSSEMADLLKAGRGIRPGTAEGYIERIRALGKQTATYRELLRTDLVELDAAIGAVREQGVALLARVE